MTCDKCGTDCKNHHMLIQITQHIDKTRTTEEVGLCWACYRTFKKEERRNDNDINGMIKSCKTLNCGKVKN